MVQPMVDAGSVPIDLSAVAGTDHGDREFRIENVVDDAIVADADTPSGGLTDEFLSTMRPRILTQAGGDLKDPATHLMRQFADLPGGRPGEFNVIGHGVRPARNSSRLTRVPSSSALAR